MHLINKSKWSKEYLREIIKFCKPPNFKMKNITYMTFKMTSRRYGSGNANITVPWDSRIEIKMSSNPDSYPWYRHYVKEQRSYMTFENGETKVHNYTRGTGGYISCLLLSEEEWLVQMIAHEIRHSFQVNNKNYHRVWGSRKGTSERDCDAYAIRKMREWRHEHYRQAVETGAWLDFLGGIDGM
jgi:hypothetical protein